MYGLDYYTKKANDILPKKITTRKRRSPAYKEQRSKRYLESKKPRIFFQRKAF